MTTPEHEDEPAGTGLVTDDAEQQRRRAEFGKWWRHKQRSAAEQGVYPVGADGLEIQGEALASWLRSAYQDDAE